MQNKKKLFSFIVLFLLTIPPFHSFSQTRGQIKIQQMIYSIEGFTHREQQQLIKELIHSFQPITSQKSLNQKILKNTAAIISAAHFEQASIKVTADIAYKAYLAELNGAPAVYVRDLSLIGISTSITADQLEMAAKGIENLMNNQITPTITEEFISYALYNNWNGETIDKAVKGLVRGVGEGIPPKKLALSFIISIDQQISEKSPEQIIDEAIQFMKSLEYEKPEKKKRQEIAYQELMKAINKGVPRAIADEIYSTAIEDKWHPETIQAVYQGIIKGMRKGLTPERLATAFFVRVAQTEQIRSPHKIIEEEIKFVEKVEKRRAKLLQKDKQKYKRKSLPPNYTPSTYLQPKPILHKQPPTYFNLTNRRVVNQQLMWQSIQDYLGPPPTPYRWGGTSKIGIDCSGLVMNLYREQGILLPRTSAEQYLTGKPVTGILQFGDLVFFSKYGPAYKVTHVGIYIGGDKFVHASASRGVVISSLNSRYYRLRYKGARRII